MKCFSGGGHCSSSNLSEDDVTPFEHELPCLKYLLYLDIRLPISFDSSFVFFLISVTFYFCFILNTFE